MLIFPSTLRPRSRRCLESGAYERHIRRLRRRYRARRDKRLAAIAETAPDAEVRGVQAGLSLLLIPADASRAVPRIAAAAAARGVALLSLAPHYAAVEAAIDGRVIGYGAIAEHEYDSALAAARR